MIVPASAEEEYPFKVLARTKFDEKAYFVDHKFSSTMLYDYDVGGAVTSFSGAEWLPSMLENGRVSIFIAGNPGAGKSYLAKDIIRTLPRDFDILLFTALEEDDGNFEEFRDRIHKIKMSPDILSRISLSEIRKRGKHPLLLFDDIDKIRDKTVEKLTYAILEDALANGRGHKKHDGEGDVHVIVTSHSLNDYKKTKYAIENTDYIAVFPQSSTFSQMKMLMEKIGLDKEWTRKIMTLGKRGDVRRVIIRKTTPMYAIMSNTIELL